MFSILCTINLTPPSLRFTFYPESIPKCEKKHILKVRMFYWASVSNIHVSNMYTKLKCKIQSYDMVNQVNLQIQ